MLDNELKSIQRERAEFVRSVEYLREMAAEDSLDDAFAQVDSEMYQESTLDEIDSYEEFLEFDSQLDGEDTYAEEEIQRIMESTDEMTFEEMLGL